MIQITQNLMVVGNGLRKSHYGIILGPFLDQLSTTATVSGTDLSGNPYTGTDSITFTIDNSNHLSR